jgi:biopolymer transport protein ExbB/biopolymer transport protein TolQ
MLAQKLLSVAQVGGSVVLYLLILLSVLSIGVIIERGLWFSRRRIDARGLGRKLSPLLAAGDRASARKLINATPGVEAEVLAEAMDWYERGPDAVAEILSTALKDRRKGFESGLIFLGTLGNNAPFIGLFGTVLGVVTAFKELGANATGAMGNVMAGIAEALIATAIGILVALPAVIAYNIFQKKTQDIEDNVAALGGLLLAELKGTPVADAKIGEARALREAREGSR